MSLSRVLSDCTPRYVGPAVHLSVCPSVPHTLLFLGGFVVFGLNAPAPVSCLRNVQFRLRGGTAAAPKGKSVGPYIHPSIHLSIGTEGQRDGRTDGQSLL